MWTDDRVRKWGALLRGGLLRVGTPALRPWLRFSRAVLFVGFSSIANLVKPNGLAPHPTLSRRSRETCSLHHHRIKRGPRSRGGFWPGLPTRLLWMERSKA